MNTSDVVRPGRRVQLVCKTKSLTKQSFKAQCDINKIVDKANATGLLTHVNAKRPSYADFSTVRGYQDALNLVMAAQESFDGLPSKVRERFSNDPSKLLDFVADVKNKQECIELGLIEKPPVDLKNPLPPARPPVSSSVDSARASGTPQPPASGG